MHAALMAKVAYQTLKPSEKACRLEAAHLKRTLKAKARWNRILTDFKHQCVSSLSDLLT